MGWPLKGVVMFHKILIGLDGSESSWCAFRRTLALARTHGSEVWALSVEEHLPHFPGTIDEVVEEHEFENAYFARIQGMAGELAAEHGVALSCRTVPGGAAARLIEFARDGAFDLIVVGHRGHESPWKRLVGSTADRLVDHAPCCVLLERAPEPSAAEPAAPEDRLVGIDAAADSSSSA
jgi:nucleotide-binding universal stress UspA family protein